MLLIPHPSNCRRASAASAAVVCLLSLIACRAEAPTPSERAEGGVYPATYSREQIAYDFGVFRTALEEAHPGLYRYRSVAEMDAVFDEAAGRLDGVQDERDLYRVLARVIAEIGDGHTGVRVSEGHANFLAGQPTYLPFKLRLIDRKAYLWRDYSEDRGDLLGSEIVSIDGQPAGEVLAEMVAHVSSDGSNVTGKYQELEGTFFFGTLYQLLFGPTETYELELRAPGSEETTTVSVDAVTQAQVEERYEERYAEKEAENLEVTFVAGPPRVAVVRIGGFFGDDYEEFLIDAFRQIDEQGIEHLIFDLRDNGGGRDVYGSMLFSYLTDEPFAYYQSLEIMAPELDILRYSQIPSRSIPEEEFEERDGRYFLTPVAHENLNLQQPREPHFDGAVYVLINGGSFSATAEFLAALYQNREATYIGEESGGGLYGNTSGSTAIITLPHTKVRVGVPLVRYNSAVEGYQPTDRGMIPDHEVHLTQQDLVEGTDSVLEFALELIRRQSS